MLGRGQCVAGSWQPVVDPWRAWGWSKPDLTEHEASVEIKYAQKVFQLVVAASEQSAKSDALALVADHMKPALDEYERDADRGSVQIQEVAERFDISGSYPQLDRVNSPEAELPVEVALEVARGREMADAQARRFVTVDVQRDKHRYVIGPVRCTLPPSRVRESEARACCCCCCCRPCPDTERAPPKKTGSPASRHGGGAAAASAAQASTSVEKGGPLSMSPR